jgi:mercuric ion transport protein
MNILKTGIGGFTLSALCCFTPLLVIVLGAVGFSAWLAWLDFVLFPIMALSMGMIAYGLYARRKN